MRRHLITVALATLAAGAAAGPGFGQATASVASAGSWGRAIEIPGLEALSPDGNIGVNSVSCASPGNCAVAGTYQTPDKNYEAFVADQRNDHWGKAIEVPGIAALDVGLSSAVSSVSCAAPGDCSAGGSYTSSEPNAVHEHTQAFVVNEQNGQWGTAIEVAGTAALNVDGLAAVSSVSCVSAGNCAAGGFYRNSMDSIMPFVVSERNGSWGTAITVPVPNPNGFADGYIEAFSCTSAGNCTGAGVGDLLAVRYVFVVTEKRGHWGRLQRIRGAPNAITEVYSLSCASAGNCAVGWTSAARGGWEAFLASEKNGSWSRAFRVPGLAPDTNSVEAVTSVSCPSAGNCLAGGDGKYAFLVSEKRGRWGKAVKVSGNGRILAISCISAGNCTAAGTSHSQAFVIRERNGRLDNPRELPGSGALNVGGIAQVNAMSCTAVGECTVAGIYRNSAHHDRGFVDSQT